jgi:hypothetical protein
MQWRDEEYGHLKEEIFELLRKNLKREHAEKLTIGESMEHINIFFEWCKNGKGKRE